MNDRIILNKEQKKAVEYAGGPLLIIAGAGTGKTTVITERIKWLISKEKAKPSEILALTFTEKASQEMEERVDIAMPYGYTQMWISTFHSFGDRILRDEGIHIGIDPGYRLMTEAQSTKFFKDNLFKFILSYFRPLGNPNKFITSMLSHFSRLKDEDLSPEEYMNWAKALSVKSEGESEPEKIEKEKYIELANAYKTYEELKVKVGKMDFSDLIGLLLKLFRQRKNILNTYRNKFKYILIDEFQDTNIAQYELIKLLAPSSSNPNLTVVGDDNQSIYKFRGAAISNILSFKNEYPKVKTIILNSNYRSTQAILDSSYKLIKNNDPDTLESKLGISKKLISERKKSGEKVELFYKDRVEKEAEEVIKKIIELENKEKYKWSDFAILVRANKHSEPFIRELGHNGIPYQFLGPGFLFKQIEVKELIAYLKVLYNLEDSSSLYFVLSMDIFNIPARELVSITAYSKKYNLNLFEAIEGLIGYWFNNRDLGPYSRYTPFVSDETKQILEKIVEMIVRHLNLSKKETAGQIIYYFLEDSGLLRKIAEFKTEKEERQAQNISKFFEKLKSYEMEHEDASVSAVVDFIDLSLELGESPLSTNTDWTENNAVNILTVHSSKGLEFKTVFLVNLVSQRFPTLERREKIPIPENLIKEILPEGNFHLQEERRLFYVGMTRARDHLFLTAANFYGEGKREKKISPFVYEVVGEENIKRQKIGKENPQLSLFNWEKKAEIIIPKATNKVYYLSYSLIQTFLTCPLHYKLRYVLRIPTPPTAALSFGSTMHAVLKEYYDYLISGNSQSLDFLLQRYQKKWQAEGFTSKKHEQLFKEKGIFYLEKFYDVIKNEKLNAKALEVPFKFPVMQNLQFGGKIDRVDFLENGRIEIIDYKTSSKVPSQSEVDKDLQMTLYALAATEVKDELFWKKPEEVILSLYYFEDQIKISTTRTMGQLEEAKKKMITIAKEIEVSDYACKGSELCRNCEYKLYCEVR